ncbi:hypothetical protein [Caballeronia zhejiangensis]|uniref:hypothetical protein n=1 Tax=Caballeronia zhejiangensis TaxID=871203 RepID=UPI001F52B36F|nr:hypothetical protein [Caballeronia zhejiangensis]MCI1046932.1 hypothetical protein [Caballeronia zhejiangensis]
MAAESPSVWVTVIQASAALLSPIIAVAAGWIAWQQVRINRNKLKLDRFEKRFAVYETTMEFLGSMIFYEKVSDHNMEQFLKVTRGAQFMLSPEVALYLDEIRRNAVRFRQIALGFNPYEQMVKSGGVLPKDPNAKEKATLVAWFKEQMEEGVNKAFAPYLSVTDI